MKRSIIVALGCCVLTATFLSQPAQAQLPTAQELRAAVEQWYRDVQVVGTFRCRLGFAASPELAQ